VRLALITPGSGRELGRDRCFGAKPDAFRRECAGSPIKEKWRPVDQ